MALNFVRVYMADRQSTGGSWNRPHPAIHRFDDQGVGRGRSQDQARLREEQAERGEVILLEFLAQAHIVASHSPRGFALLLRNADLSSRRGFEDVIQALVPRVVVDRANLAVAAEASA